MGALRFTSGVVLVVASAIFLLGVGAIALALAVGEMAGAPDAYARLAAYFLAAILCAAGAYRTLRPRAAARAADRT